MSRKLKTGTYIIRSVAVKDGCIGRSKREQQDLAPKKVFSLPAHHDVQQFVVEALDNGRYQLWAGSPTATVDGHLSAILLSSPPPEEWNIVYQPSQKAYTIETASRDRSWTIPSKEGFVQVAVRPSTRPPPRYPENELFTFEAMQPHDD
ncbi:hypothetical protein SERLADRAFT_399343 [Serpula lacrymans var. lacrymans S7.9]|nr:uncharacterized protein SERLADRAFT_399343 [Serpula lacrymans var. lacrymans S7.9]EGO20477.1 hypothetical protein SERLADRAFT_399343 [Serpula lacrymans var. lacrymans S7.9]